MAHTFPNISNIDESLQLLSSELDIFGYPELQYECGNEKTLVQLIDITWRLLSDLKQFCIKRNERTVELAKLKSMMKNQNEEKLNLEKLLNKERKATLNVKESLESTENLKKILEKDLRKCKLELKKSKKSMENQNIRHGNEILAKENAICNLKFKLNMFVNNDFTTDKEEESFTQKKFLLLAKSPKLKEYVNTLNNNIQFLILENANLKNLILKVILVLSDKCKTKRVTEKEVSLNLFNLSGENLIDNLEKEFENILTV